MTSITLHAQNPVQRPPSPATVSARAINVAPTRANADDHFNTKAQSFSRNSPLAQELLPVTDIVIQAEALGKKYTIGHQAEKERYLALRDVLVNNARSFWRTTSDLLRGKPIIQGNNLEEVWALKDVSFRNPARGI